MSILRFYKCNKRGERPWENRCWKHWEAETGKDLLRCSKYLDVIVRRVCSVSTRKSEENLKRQRDRVELVFRKLPPEGVWRVD